MSKRKGDSQVKAVRIPRGGKGKRKRKGPKRPPAKLPEPVASFEF